MASVGFMLKFKSCPRHLRGSPPPTLGHCSGAVYQASGLFPAPVTLEAWLFG